MNNIPCPIPIEKIVNPTNFEQTALEVFRYQFLHNPVYNAFCKSLHIDIKEINHTWQIPFLPISLFKTHRVVTGDKFEPQIIFESSGTTGDTPSRHFVLDKGLYEANLLAGFSQFYGDPAQYSILALLPSYLERKNASLVYMAQTLMNYSAKPANGFYIHEFDQLAATLAQLVAANRPTLLLGVTFALLDFAETHPLALKNTIVMETGGMKGRREEMTRQQVHDILETQFGLTKIHSEYGMTELLSQAYSTGEGLYECSKSMQVMVRDINDPLEVNTSGSGIVNVIDLANIHSCSFIATDDLGNVFADGSFEILGRADHSALRGCSLMAI